MPTKLQLDLAMAKTLLHRSRDIDRQIQLEERCFGLSVEASQGVPKDAGTIIEGVIRVMERKDKLIVLKNKIEQIVARFPAGLEQIARSCFFNGQKPNVVALKLGVTPSAVYQQLQRATKLFASRMGRMGIDKEMFKHLVKLYPWMGLDLVYRLRRSSAPTRQHDCKRKETQEVNQTDDEGGNVSQRRCA